MSFSKTVLKSILSLFLTGVFTIILGRISVVHAANCTVNDGLRLSKTNVTSGEIITLSWSQILNGDERISLRIGGQIQQEVVCSQDPSRCQGVGNNIIVFDTSSLSIDNYTVDITTENDGQSNSCTLPLNVVRAESSYCENIGLTNVNPREGLFDQRFAITGCMGGIYSSDYTRIVITNSEGRVEVEESIYNDGADHVLNSDGTFAIFTTDLEDVGRYTAQLHTENGPIGQVIAFNIVEQEESRVGQACEEVIPCPGGVGNYYCTGVYQEDRGEEYCEYDRSADCTDCAIYIPDVGIIDPEEEEHDFKSEYKICNQIPDTTQRGYCDICRSNNGVWTAIGCISTKPAEAIGSLISIALGIAGGVALLLTLAAGFMFTTSKGDPKRTGDAKDLLQSAIIGLFFVIFSVTILQFIGSDILKIPGFGG